MEKNPLASFNPEINNAEEHIGEFLKDPKEIAKLIALWKQMQGLYSDHGPSPENTDHFSDPMSGAQMPQVSANGGGPIGLTVKNQDDLEQVKTLGRQIGAGLKDPAAALAAPAAAAKIFGNRVLKQLSPEKLGEWNRRISFPGSK